MGKIIFCVLILALACCFYMVYYIDHISKQISAQNKREKDADDVKDTPVSPNDYRKTLADECISSNDYRFATNRRDVFLQATSNSGQLGILWSKLMQTDIRNNHLSDEQQQWFLQHLEEFINYGETLAFIEHYPLLEDLFLDNLPMPEQNLALQKRLISVCIVGSWRINYVNLLCKYLSKWDLLPEIKAIVFYDYRFERVKNMYDLYRKSRADE